MSLLAKIKNDLKEAMKSGRAADVTTLRMVTSEIKNKGIEAGNRDEIPDETVVAVLRSMVKKYKDSIEQFRAGGRADLAAKEEVELALVQAYLPTDMNAEQIDAIVARVVKETGAVGAKDMGKVMSGVMAEVKGRADGKIVSERVKAVLKG